MATTNDRRDRRDDRDDDRGEGQQPWDLCRIVEVKKRDGKLKEEWVRCGVAWPMREREGFTFDLHFTIPEGSRMAIMPRQPKNGGR